MAFPAALSNAVDGVTEIVAAHLNNLEAKVGIDNSSVPTSLDYLLKNAASLDPGHKHSKLWAADGSPEAVTVDAAGIVSINTKLTINNIGESLKLVRSNYNDWSLYQSNPSGSLKGLGIYEGTAAQHRLFIGEGGNIGIGTETPYHKLAIYDPTTGQSEHRIKIGRGYDASAANRAAGITLGAAVIASPTKEFNIDVFSGLSYFNSASFLIYRGSNANKDDLVINSSGHIGIGTSPGKKLDVNGYLRGIGIFNTLNSAPADGDLAAGECALWFDKSDGAAKLMIKAKQNDGTVKIGSVSLN